MRNSYPEIIGITLIGPQPIGTVHIPWGPGLHVFYGFNAVGKSTILRGIEGALSGRVYPKEGGVFSFHNPRAFLHLRDSHSTSTTESSGAKARIKPGRRESTPSPLTDAAVAELEDRRWFTVEATGRETPEWTVWESLAPDSPAVDDLHDRLLHLASLDISRSPSGTWVSHEADLATWRSRTAFLEDGGVAPEDELPLAQVEELLSELELLQKRFPSFDAMYDHYENFDYMSEERHEWATFEELDDIYSSWIRDALTAKLEIGDALLVTSFFDGRPDWVPVPVRKKSDTFEPVPLPIDNFAQVDVDQRTMEFLAKQHAEDDTTELADNLQQTGSDLARTGSRFLGSIIQESPTLTFWVDRTRLLYGDWGNWQAADPYSGTNLDLKRLSESQRRWSQFAISYAVETAHSRIPSAMILDEPDQALHPRAIDDAATGLLRYASEIGIPVFVATHSPQFLAAHGALLHQVVRPPGMDSSIQSLKLSATEALSQMADELGVSSTDILQMYRVFLLVEGDHDQAVIDGILGDRLTNNRCRVLPLRGTRQAVSAVEGEVLVDATDAAIVFAVDNAESSELVHIWQEARSLNATEGSKAALKALGRFPVNGKATSEQNTVRSILWRAIRTGRADRVHVFGFEKPDIIEYFEPRDYGMNESSWADVVSEWKLLPYGRPRFKDWLSTSKGARISARRLSSLSSHVEWDDAHADFHDLDSLISEASLFGPAGPR